MTNKLTETEVVVVLDRSGSMSSCKTGTLEGFNTFLNEQQNAAGDGFMTLVQFDDQYQVDYQSVNSKLVAPLTDATFVPRGMTALHDAIGKTINGLKTDRDVVFVIITDGLENASREFTKEAIKTLIEDKTKQGWKFIYLGANQDAVLVGSGIGVNAKMSMSYMSDDVHSNVAFSSTASNVKDYRAAKSRGIVADDISFADEQRLRATE